MSILLPWSLVEPRCPKRLLDTSLSAAALLTKILRAIMKDSAVKGMEPDLNNLR